MFQGRAPGIVVKSRMPFFFNLFKNNWDEFKTHFEFRINLGADQSTGGGAMGFSWKKSLFRVKRRKKSVLCYKKKVVFDNILNNINA